MSEQVPSAPSGTTETQGEPPMCSTVVIWLFGPDEPCGRPGEVALRIGCVHEHVDYAVECRTHADGYLAPTGQWFCNACTASAQSHKCPVTVTEVRRG